METIDRAGQEPALVVRQLGPAFHFAPQNGQLLPKRCVLSLSRLFDLNGEVRTARTQQMNAIIEPA